MIAMLRRVLVRAALSLVLALAPAALRADQSSIVTPTSGPHSMTDFTTNYLNPALRALLSCSGGAAAPTNGPNNLPLAGECWLDTSTTPLTLRYYDGGQWLAFANIDATGHIVSLPNPTLTGAVKITGLTGFVYANGSGALTAAVSIPTTALSGPLQAAQVPAFTGDFTCSGLTCTLATVNGAPGTSGGASSIPVVTVDAKGRVTGVTTIAVVAPAGTLTGTSLPSNVVSSNLGTFAAGAAYNNLAANSLDNGKLATMPTLTVKANIAAGTAQPTDPTFQALLDAAFSSTQGQIICRTSGGWSGISASGAASGYVLAYSGANSCPAPQSPSAAAAVPRSAVRQTVQGGPQASGAPSFLPATSASLSLTAQNVSTGSNALTVAAAQGSNVSGQNDTVYQFTSNPAWSSLTASATNYLYVNASSGATGSTTLVPIYQFGGTPSTTNGQFTFDYQAMIGYLGNGTSAVATPIVLVGEAVTSASGVTSTVAYAYNGYYESAWTGTAPAITTATSYTSNLGVSEATPNLVVEWTTATSGYAVGERIPVFVYDSASATNANLPLSVTRLTASFTTGNVSAFYYYAKGGSFARGAIAAGATTMRFKMVAKRNF